MSISLPLLIATLHSPFCLEKVKKDFKKLSKAEGIDFLEVRLDSLPQEELPREWPLPVIATARHPEEGGKNNLSLDERCSLLEQSLIWSHAIDVELSSIKEVAPIIASARAERKLIIGSFHDLKTVPSLPCLRDLIMRAQDAAIDVLKVAVTINDEASFLRVIEFQQSEKNFPLATMGMGEKFGKISRLVLPSCGSRLAYGYLAKPLMPGQWSAEQLAFLLTRRFHPPLLRKQGKLMNALLGSPALPHQLSQLSRHERYEISG